MNLNGAKSGGVHATFEIQGGESVLRARVRIGQWAETPYIQFQFWNLDTSSREERSQRGAVRDLEVEFRRTGGEQQKFDDIAEVALGVTGSHDVAAIAKLLEEVAVYLMAHLGKPERESAAIKVE